MGCRREAAFLKPAVLVALTNAIAALPAHADAGKIFDFNLTLPIMTGQFLLLMVFLDKFWFGPVGEVLDKRDGYIREQLQKFKARAPLWLPPRGTAPASVRMPSTASRMHAAAPFL